MALNGSSCRWKDSPSTTTPANAENLNSMDMGGNVYQSAVGGLKVDVSAIRGIIGDTIRDYAGVTEEALTNNTTNYLYLNSSGVLTKNTTGFPTYGTGSGQEIFFPLAEVVTSGGAISTITDKRCKFFV